MAIRLTCISLVFATGRMLLWTEAYFAVSCLNLIEDEAACLEPISKIPCQAGGLVTLTRSKGPLTVGALELPFLASGRFKADDSFPVAGKIRNGSMTYRRVWHSEAMPIGEAKKVKPAAAESYAVDGALL